MGQHENASRLFAVNTGIRASSHRGDERLHSWIEALGVPNHHELSGSSSRIENLVGLGSCIAVSLPIDYPRRVICASTNSTANTAFAGTNELDEVPHFVDLSMFFLDPRNSILEQQFRLEESVVGRLQRITDLFRVTLPA